MTSIFEVIYKIVFCTFIYKKEVYLNFKRNLFSANGPALPVANHLDEAGGLELPENVRDDVSSAQHALQAARPQDAVQLGQEEEHVVHKTGTWKKRIFEKLISWKSAKTQTSTTTTSNHVPIHEGWKVLWYFIQANDELVIQVPFLQIGYFTCSEIEKFLLKLWQKHQKNLFFFTNKIWESDKISSAFYQSILDWRDIIQFFYAYFHLKTQWESASYFAHVGQILQGEADDFCGGCVDLLVPHEGQVARQRLYVSECKKDQKNNTQLTFFAVTAQVESVTREFYLLYSIPQEASNAGRLFARMIPSSWSPTELSLLFGSVPRNRS